MHPQLISLVLLLISWPICSCALELCVVCLCPFHLAPVLFYCWASWMGPQTCIGGSLVSRMAFRHVRQIAPSLAVPKWTFWWTLHLTCSLAPWQCREAATNLPQCGPAWVPQGCALVGGGSVLPVLLSPTASAASGSSLLVEQPHCCCSLTSAAKLSSPTNQSKGLGQSRDQETPASPKSKRRIRAQ